MKYDATSMASWSLYSKESMLMIAEFLAWIGGAGQDVGRECWPQPGRGFVSLDEGRLGCLSHVR